MSSVGIVDLEIGNLRSVYNAVFQNGFDPEFVKDPAHCDRYDHLILPGVGAFHTAAEKLVESGFGAAIGDHARKGKPLLGICLGMQLLADKGEEGGRDANGLGLVPGSVKRFEDRPGYPVPHVGWNNVRLQRKHPVTSVIRDDLDFYFVHSFFFTALNSEDVLGTTDYGGDFASVVTHEATIGFQFHPEKSQLNGMKLIDGFLRWRP